MTAIERRTTVVGARRFSYRLSLWAYAPAFLWLVSVAIVAPWIAALSLTAAVGILSIAALWCLYRVWWLHSVELFGDDEGVWIFRGVMPWSRGVYGVKWRNLDEAAYFTGFVSWLTKSYRITATHRYTKASEINLAHVARGDLAVAQINELAHQLRDRPDVAPGYADSQQPENVIARAD